MPNSGHKVVAMLVGVVLMTLGCEEKELESLESEPSSSAPVLAWAEVLEQTPDREVVTNAGFLRRITETKLPWRVKDKASGIEMLLVPPGKFVMGMSPGDSGADTDERPAHEVTITKPFYLGRTEVTVEQWVKLMGANPSKTKLGSSEPSLLLTEYISNGLTKAEANHRAGIHPSIAISWDDCHEFCTKVGLSLPTEAQWEYACRAGLRAPTYDEGWGDTLAQRLNPIAWSGANSAGRTHSVAEKAPNALGFYDMLGNVSEWCEDWYGSDYYKSCEDGVVDPSGPQSGESRVLRGGSWSNGADYVRSSYRYHLKSPNLTNSTIGFRVARTP